MSMNEMQQEKKKYLETEIPKELGGRVQAGIRQGKAAYRSSMAKRRWRRTALTTAACFAVVMAGLNISPTFASAAADVPVLGKVFQILTLRQYTDNSTDYVLQVTQPAVSGTANAEKINAEIQEKIDERVAEGKQMVVDNKEAFFATGGTQAEWAQRDKADIMVSYEVKSQTDTTVSFMIDSYINAGFSNEEQYYYNIDLADGRELTLADVLGQDWVEICNRSIQEQMASAEDPTVYFDDTMGGFTTVDETTQFYLNADGQAVVVFPRATVAIGAMGIVEFPIAQ